MKAYQTEHMNYLIKKLSFNDDICFKATAYKFI